jgi:protein tyrosine/serine phosphatase
MAELTKNNFREISCGKIARGILYRSNHPCQPNTGNFNENNKYGINCILNLSDTYDKAEVLSQNCDWYNKLLVGGKAIALDMKLMFACDDSYQKLKCAIKFMLSNEPPYLIHCHAGVDRTGMVSAILEAFMGATLSDIVHDCSMSFETGFASAVVEGQNPDIKEIVKQQFLLLNDNVPIDFSNLQPMMERFLMSKIGLSKSELEKLQTALSESN